MHNCFLLICIKPGADLIAKLTEILFFISVKCAFWVNLFILYVHLQTNNIIENYYNRNYIIIEIIIENYIIIEIMLNLVKLTHLSSKIK